MIHQVSGDILLSRQALAHGVAPHHADRQVGEPGLPQG